LNDIEFSDKHKHQFLVQRLVIFTTFHER